MITPRTYVSLSKKKYERIQLAFNVIQKKILWSAEKILLFGPNNIVEVRPNSSVKSNIRSVTSVSGLGFAAAGVHCKPGPILRDVGWIGLCRLPTHFQYFPFSNIKTIYQRWKWFSFRCPLFLIKIFGVSKK